MPGTDHVNRQFMTARRAAPEQPPWSKYPRRVGKPLRGELTGIHTARRRTYRVSYRINGKSREAVVVRIDPRSDAYRPR